MPFKLWMKRHWVFPQYSGCMLQVFFCIPSLVVLDQMIQGCFSSLERTFSTKCHWCFCMSHNGFYAQRNSGLLKVYTCTCSRCSTVLAPVFAQFHSPLSVVSSVYLFPERDWQNSVFYSPINALLEWYQHWKSESDVITQCFRRIFAPCSLTFAPILTRRLCRAGPIAGEAR